VDHYIGRDLINGTGLALSEARSWLVGCGSDTHAAFIGGSIQPFALSSAVDLYDEASGTLVAGPPLPSGLIFHAAASINAGDFIVAGGTNEDGVTSAVHILHAGSKKWTSADFLASNRTRLAAAAVVRSTGGPLACFAGGEGDGVDGEAGWHCNLGFCVSDLVECFNSTGNVVHTLHLQSGRSRLAGVAAPEGCVMIFAGGKSSLEGGSVSSDVDHFDFCASPPKHTTLSRLSQPRMDLAAVALRGEGIFSKHRKNAALFLGGNANNGTVSDFADTYDDI